MPKREMLCNFIEIALRHGSSPVNLLAIFRIHFYNIFIAVLEHLWRPASLYPIASSAIRNEIHS